jgi:glycosyltransferase involved in cell wall biosynthesis
MMIEALALCDRRFSLHFMLLNNDPEYLKELKRLAEELTPGRIIFHNPVPPEDVVLRVSEFDVGFCLIAPTNYNYLVSLPNKFFDYIMAGLAVCIGPSPSMEEIVYEYGLGFVAPSFDPRDVAETLNQLTNDRLAMMRKASQEAAKKINGESEMRKLVELYDRLDI